MKTPQKFTVLAINILLMFAAFIFFACPDSSGNNKGNDPQIPEPSGPFGITISSTIVNGTITVQGGGTQAETGSTVTLNISPANGYAIDTITALPSEGENVPVAINGDSASFTMPPANVFILAQFKQTGYEKPPDPPAGQYSIFINGPFANGDVSVQSGFNASAPGKLITLNIMPQSGCALVSINATRDSETSTPLMGNGNTRTFTMPADNVTITAVFQKMPEYTITVTQTEYGTLSSDKATAIQGETVTLTIVPDPECSLISVEVKAGTATVSVTQVNATTRTFVMPAVNVAASAKFMQGSDPLAAYFSNDFDTSLCSFFDKFDGTALDNTKWSHQNGRGNWGWGNGENQSYETANCTVSDGSLKLTAKRTGSGDNDYTSGKLVTAQGDAGAPGGNSLKFAQTYGRFEARIRITGEAQGMWPAFWMMPVTNTYGGWPNSGEIDIMEQKGRFPTEASSTIHMQKTWGHHYRGADYYFPNNERITDWHVYSVVWSADEFNFLIDGLLHKKILRADWRGSNSADQGNASSSAPFDKNFFIILNLAVGGQFDDYRRPPDSAMPIALEIDWVRAYTLANDPWPANFGTHTSRSYNN